MGRPTKLTPKVQETLCDALRDGKTEDYAASLVGINPSTLWRWKRLGARGTEPYATFCNEYARARAEGADALLNVAREAAFGREEEDEHGDTKRKPGNPDLALRLLKITHADRFGHAALTEEQYQARFLRDIEMIAETYLTTEAADDLLEAVERYYGIASEGAGGAGEAPGGAGGAPGRGDVPQTTH